MVDPPVYGVDDLDDDVDVDVDGEDDDIDDDEDTSSSNLAAADIPASDPRSSYAIVTVASAPDQTHVLAIPAAAAADKKPVAAAGLFQRLWTDEDEIELLQGFLEYTSQRGGAQHSQHHDTAAFYDQIKSKLQLDFNKNQLVEKLRRLKKKYRTIAGKMSLGKEYVFKSAHDQATFEISKKIWYEPVTRFVEPGSEDNELNPSNYSNPNFIWFHQNDNGADLNLKGSAKPKKRVKLVKSDEVPLFSPQVPQVATPVGSSVSGLIEETVKSCFSPILKELARSSTSHTGGFGGMGGMSPMGFNFGNIGPLEFASGGEMGGVMDEKWRKQQILELEAYSKRLVLVQEQIKLAMEELRAKGS